MDTLNEYGNQQIHLYLLSIIDDVDKCCREHNIKYSLSGGTLLGAVRDKGYIPWDDDMDIMFDRRNYYKFLRAYKKYMSDDYKIVGKSWVKRITKKDNPDMDKELGCIDLFVFDPVPESRLAAKGKVLMLKFLQGMLKDNNDYSSFSPLYRVLLFVTWAVGRLFSKRTKLRWYSRLSKWSGFSDDYSFVNIYNTWFDQIGRLRFEKEIISGYTDVDFEGRRFMSISGYDRYLTVLYGDYMTPPEQKDRKPMHR